MNLDPKYVLVAQCRDEHGVMQVRVVYGPYKSPRKALKAKRQMDFPTPEYVLVKRIWK